jgi:phage protein, HK97 gp10 family
MPKARIIYGDKGFELAIKQFEKSYIDEVKKIVAETAELIASSAKANAPVDTGNLRDSIQVDYSGDGLTAVVHVDASYAVYLNYGTGIYAEGPGGSSAKKIPWVYYSESLGRWVMTHGVRATHFWDDAVSDGSNHFSRALNRLG